jgi:hypothetical protein
LFFVCVFVFELKILIVVEKIQAGEPMDISFLGTIHGKEWTEYHDQLCKDMTVQIDVAAGFEDELHGNASNSTSEHADNDGAMDLGM